MLAFAGLFAWYFLHLAMARHFGGGGWGGDWHEHFDRTRYFLHEVPNDFKYVGWYLLPARPPMMNVIASFYCRQVGMSFEAFSLVFLFLNAFAFLPCCLLLGRMGRGSAKKLGVMVILFMLNPSIVQNATFTWTKAMCAGFVVLGVCFYLRWLDGKGRSWLIAAELTMAAAILIHYSAVPYALILAVHGAWVIWRTRRGLADAIAGLGPAVALLGSWFVWSIAVFGNAVTFGSNTVVAWTTDQTVTDRITKAFYNYFTNLVPFPLHPAPVLWFQPIQTWADVRDYYFMMSQRTLPMMMGCTAGFIVIAIF